MIVAAKELLVCTCLWAITMYTKAGKFGQALLATVASVHYLYTVSVFHMQQPHQCLLAVIVIARVPRSV